MLIRSRTIELFILVLAGEMIFSLPFHIARFYRPTLLETLDLSNTQLGDMFAIYGLIAMLCYFPGGWLADRLPNRALMSAALWLTSLGGLYMATMPSFDGMRFLFAYWGMTTILLFWSALISATRVWGGQNLQGRAFGLLDGGRGLMAATFASVTVWLVHQLLPTGLEHLDQSQRIITLQTVIYVYTGVTAGAGILVWLLPEYSTRAIQTNNHSGKGQPGETLNIRLIILQALIIVCAYCGYKGLDYYGWYLHQVLGYSELESARLTSVGAYVRPIAAVLAGIIADRMVASKSITVFFLLLTVSYLLLAATNTVTTQHSLLMINLLFSAAIVFGIRGIYFALLQEARIPLTVTGTATGIVSVIGFTPDIFFASFAGRILDASTGTTGFQHFFWWLTTIAVVGALTTALLTIVIRRSPANS